MPRTGARPGVLSGPFEALFGALTGGTARIDDEAGLPRIIRSDDARLSAQPFELPLLGTAPSFPLSSTDADRNDSHQRSEEEFERRVEERIQEERARRAEESTLQLEQAREEAFARGYDEGYAVAKEESREALRAFQAEVSTQAIALRILWDDLIRSSEPMLLDVAILLAQAVLDTPLAAGIRQDMAVALSRTIEDLCGEGTLRVALHPADFLRLQETGMAEQLVQTHPSLRWDPDPEFVQGDWSVESPLSVIRSRREEILRAAINHLGLAQEADRLDSPRTISP